MDDDEEEPPFMEPDGDLSPQVRSRGPVSVDDLVPGGQGARVLRGQVGTSRPQLFGTEGDALLAALTSGFAEVERYQRAGPTRFPEGSASLISCQTVVLCRCHRVGVGLTPRQRKLCVSISMAPLRGTSRRCRSSMTEMVWK